MSDAYEGKMCALEEFFHVFRITTEATIRGVFAFVKFNGTDWAQGLFVAKNEVNGFIFDKTVSLKSILVTNFVVQQS